MVANELIEAIGKISLSPYEHRVFWIVVRFTYGYKKKDSHLPLPLLIKATNLPKQLVWRSLTRLVRRNLLTKIGRNQYGVQKNYSLWQAESSVEMTGGKSSVEMTKSHQQRLLESSAEMTQQIPINKTYKENIKKGSSPSERQKYEQEIAFLDHKVGHHTDMDTLRRLGKFHDWLAYLNKASNKVGVLIEAFKAWHKTATDIDWENLGGRMGKLYTLANKDAGYLLKIIWETAAADIAGSHLSFIQGKLRKEHHAGAKGIGRQLPSEYETPEQFRARTSRT